MIEGILQGKEYALYCFCTANSTIKQEKRDDD